MAIVIAYAGSEHTSLNLIAKEKQPKLLFFVINLVQPPGPLKRKALRTVLVDSQSCPLGSR